MTPQGHSMMSLQGLKTKVALLLINKTERRYSIKCFLGLKKRYAIFAKSTKVKVCAPLPFPLAQSKKILIPGIHLKFILKRANNKLVLMTSEPEDVLV